MVRRQLLLLSLILLTLILVVSSVIDYASYRDDREQKSLNIGRLAGEKVAGQLDAIMFAITERADEYAREVAGATNEQALLESIRAESQRFPLVLGVTVAFEPGAFLGKERYAPFFNKELDRFQFVDESYDYTSTGLETTRWYTRVVATGKSQWSEPYFAEAAQVMVVDYGVPLLNLSGQVVGVVDYSVTLSDFTRIVDELSVGQAGYGFTYDQDGTILSHPNPEFLLENVFQLRDGKTQDILDTMRNHQAGVVQYHSTYTFENSWFFFRAMESTGWKSVLVFAEDDLLGASDEGRKKIIRISLGASALLIALVLFLFSFTHPGNRGMWTVAATISLIVIGNIVLIWYLNLTTDFSRLGKDHSRIVNKSILAKHVRAFDDNLYQLTQERYRQVPTGIFIESYEMGSFEVSLIGRLWMKYPSDLYQSARPAFYLPDVSALEPRGLVSEIISEIETDRHILVTWKFRVTLEQDFSYQQYPFEQNEIQLVLLHPDISKRILLVPDLGSYDILNPSVRPGLNQSLRVPSSKAVASFFSFKPMNYKTTFGVGDNVQNHPALTFSIVEKRVFLSPFIANIIPVLIVAFIMFIVLYTSSRHSNERSGLTTMNVVQSSAGLLFILVLAHVNERNRIETPDIAYIELFYFSMYIFITLQLLVLAMLLGGKNWRIFTYRDNLILKLLFWPAILTTWLGITLLRFY
jgi:hypothetical protein